MPMPSYMGCPAGAEHGGAQALGESIQMVDEPALERFGHFVEDGLGGFGGVGGLGDGAAYDQEAGAQTQRIRRGGGSLLAPGLRSGGANAGNHQDALWDR